MPVIIQDTAFVATSETELSPTGEALLKKNNLTPMTKTEREAMMDRLFTGISQIMDKAKTTHLMNNKKPGSEEKESKKPGSEEKENNIDYDYITRVSTNEFFFYTQEPLTLEEFHALQKKILDKAKTLDPGVQLILGSFAVKTSQNRVMNVTPHISCGDPPSFQNIVKSFTSPIDFHYTEADAEADANTDPEKLRKDLDPLDTITPIFTLPEGFTFNNIVECCTPGGTKFLTAIDICYDHHFGVAQTYLKEFLSKYPNKSDLFISHVLISNSIMVEKSHSIGIVLHVDPIHSLQEGCKEHTKQAIEDAQQQYFGIAKIKVIGLNSSPCFTLSYINSLPETTQLFLILQQLPYTNEKFIANKIKEYESTETPQQRKSIQNKLLEQIKITKDAEVLIRELCGFIFGDKKDTLMIEYIQGKINEFKNADTDEITTSWITEVSSLVANLKANPELNNIRTSIDTLKTKATLLNSNKKKAQNIEDVMSTIPIEDRATLTIDKLKSIDGYEKLRGVLTVSDTQKLPIKQTFFGALYSKAKTIPSATPVPSKEKKDPKTGMEQS